MSQNLESHSDNVSIVDAGRPWSDRVMQYYSTAYGDTMTPVVMTNNQTFTVTLDRNYYQPNDIITNPDGRTFYYDMASHEFRPHLYENKPKEAEYSFFDLIALKRD
jgi:hypothetical protein